MAPLIEGITGKKGDVVIGKPSVLTAKMALNMLKLKNDECLVIGDRLETDILMGKQAGMQTALVLTGITREEDVAQRADIRPDYILQSVADLLEINVAG